MKWVLLLIVTMSVILSGCQSGSSSNSGLPPERPQGTAAGKAQHGPIVNATISGYNWDGEKGEFLSSTTSDSDGRYALNVDAPSSFIMIESQGGNYQEEATGRDVSMGNDGLKAVIRYEQGQAVNVQLTYFTHLAACRAEYLVGTGVNVGNAIVQANNEFSAIIGESITGVEPVDTTKTESFTPFMTPAHRYGIAVSAVSLAVDTLRQENGNILGDETYTVKYFTNLGCKDILSDGALNGIGEATTSNPSGQLYLGNTALDTETYRRLLAQSVIGFGSHENNKTGLNSDALLSMANSISKSASNLFGGTEGEPVDNEAPTIAASLAEGTLLADSVDIQFDIQDPLGVNTVDFYLDGELFAAGQVDNPVMKINTALYADGDHELSVIASDVLGNTSALTSFTYRFINTGAAVAFNSPTLVSSTAYTATGTFVDNGAGIDRIEVNGVDAIILAEEGAWSVDITLDGGQSTVTAIIYDSLGNSAQADFVVNVDLFDPVITYDNIPASFTNYDGDFGLCEDLDINEGLTPSRPICLNAERVSLNGLPVRRSLTNDDYIVLAADFYDPQGQGTFSDAIDITVEYQILLNGEITRDWSALPRSIDQFGDLITNKAYLPVTTEYFGDNFYQTSWTDVFRVNMRVTDKTGRTDSIEFEFTLDVLPPNVAINTNINDTLFTTTSFENRGLLSGVDTEIAYTFNNDSSLPYLFSLNYGSNHGVTQQYKSAVRENLAYVTKNVEWKAKFADSNSFISPFSFNFVWEDIPSLVLKSGIHSSPPLPVPLSDMKPYYTDIVSVPVPATPWEKQPVCSADELTPHVNGASYGWRHPVDTSRYACVKRNASSPVESHFYKRTVYTVTYQPGYPRNVVTEHETILQVINESIRVINEIESVEILPTGGWYRIPPKSSIKIVRVVKLPDMTTNTDNRVVLNDETVPYIQAVSQDTHLTWDVDTTLKITRAIDPGSFDLINQVSQSTSTEGEGVKTYSLSL